MEYDFLQAYDRRMRRFNSTVISGCLAFLALLITLCWPLFY